MGNEAVTHSRSPSHAERTAWIEQACLLEATARKPGNVHPEASFSDLTYGDFVTSARIVAPILARAEEWGVGPTILKAIEHSRHASPRNTNLGIVLLLAPLAAVPAAQSLSAGIEGVLHRLTQQDAEAAYQAIRLAHAGGLGKVESEDVGAAPSVTLLEAMELAAHRDSIAAQYARNFETVLDRGMPLLAAIDDFENHWEDAVVRLHLTLMSELPDTLIARKCGNALAEEAAERARNVLESGGPDSSRGQVQLDEFDAWLRADGHRRNPGATADLVAACLFAGFREGTIRVPRRDKKPGS